MTKVLAVPHIDLNRYLGRWYEIVRLPQEHEDELATDISANYAIDENGEIRVENLCLDEEGRPVSVVGHARAVDEKNSKLKISFLPSGLRWIPFTEGDYWVLKIDDGYLTALIGTPDRKYLWVLARTPHISSETLAEYLAEARRQGFDLGSLITPLHTGREVTDPMVAEI